MQRVNIMWFRRDLRFTDNTALFHALQSDSPVIPLFIFDSNILDLLEDADDRRVLFIRTVLEEMQSELVRMGSTLLVYTGTALDAFKDLHSKYSIDHVFVNHDYETYALQRDQLIREYTAANNIRFTSFKDQVIWEKDEVVKQDGKPFTVFTPYSRAWKAKIGEMGVKSFPSEKFIANFLQQAEHKLPTLSFFNFTAVNADFPEYVFNESMLKAYQRKRDFPAENGTSGVSMYLRFGTVSIRELVSGAMETSETYLNELIWREFYQMILWQFPHVGQGKAFKPEYDSIEWRRDEGEFEKWCSGQTGYPIVDAGMRELNQTGLMHNRLRMITASFLSKHLLLDWRLGEAWFARKLLDFDLASNNGGWQWAAGSGCDAAPYFRIFNPYLQTKRFDPQFEYIRKWVPEFMDPAYPSPIVDHMVARKRCLEVYSKALKKEMQA